MITEAKPYVGLYMVEHDQFSSREICTMLLAPSEEVARRYVAELPDGVAWCISVCRRTDTSAPGYWAVVDSWNWLPF